MVSVKKKTKFTPAMKARICREVGLGKSLRKVLKQKGMPSISRTMAVLQEDEAWQEQYARAKRAGIELHIDGMIDLADEATEDNAHAIRIRVDTRKWIASKLLPKVYGDKIAAEVTLPESLAPMDRDQRLLEVGRNLAYILTAASAVAARGSRLLPAPAEPASAEVRGAAEAPQPATHSPTPDAAAEAEAEQRTARTFENEIDRDIRRRDAPQAIAPARYRPRWQR